MNQRERIIIFSDGACSGNPGPGGWGAIVLLPNDQVFEMGGAQPSTTNNQMEMLAALESLRAVNQFKVDVDFYTDSTYLIKGITQWVYSWNRNGWKTAEGKEVANRDIWEALVEVLKKRPGTAKINWLYSRGHIGIPGNERCDEIAVAFSKNEPVELYRGDLAHYGVNVLALPKDTKVPERSSASTEKKVAHSYLSNIGGIVYRHKTWPECQRRTSGQSGAKFKKSTSPADELEILKSWGLPPNITIKE